MNCPVEGCVRGDGINWGNGPTLCVPHRAEWAADHEEELTPAERKHWIRSYTWEEIGDDGQRIGRPWCAWPDNFKAARRPTAAELNAHNERMFVGWRAERERVQKERLERYRDEKQYEPGFGQRRWGQR